MTTKEFKGKEIIICVAPKSESFNQFDALAFSKIFKEKKSVAIVRAKTRIATYNVEDAVSVEIELKCEEMLSVLHGINIGLTANIDKEKLELIEKSSKVVLVLSEELTEFALRVGFKANIIINKAVHINILAKSCGYVSGNLVDLKYEKDEYIPDKDVYKLKNNYNIFFELFPILDRDTCRYVMDTDEGKEKYPALHDLVYHLYMHGDTNTIIPIYNSKFLCFLLACKYFHKEIFDEEIEYHTMLELIHLNSKLIDAFHNMRTFLEKMGEFYNILYHADEDADVKVLLIDNGIEVSLTDVATSNFAKLNSKVAEDMVIDVLQQTDALNKIFEGNVKYEIKTNSRIMTQTVDLKVVTSSIEFKIIV